MERQSIDEARAIGRSSVGASIRPAIEDIFVEFTLENVIEFYKRLGMYAHRFKFQDTSSGRKHVMMIRHETGTKWSAFYEGTLKGLFEDELGISIKTHISQEVCIGRYEL